MGGFGTVYEAKPLPPRGEINFGVPATVAISARLVSATQVARQVARPPPPFPITTATDW